MRVVYVVADDELDQVRRTIEAALAKGDGWSAVAQRSDRLTADEAVQVERMRGHDR